MGIYYNAIFFLLTLSMNQNGFRLDIIKENMLPTQPQYDKLIKLILITCVGIDCWLTYMSLIEASSP